MFPFSLLNSGILDSHPTVPGPYTAQPSRCITPKEIFTDYKHVMTHIAREWKTKGRVQRKPAKERVKRAPAKERIMKPGSVPKKNSTHTIRKKTSKRGRHAHVPTEEKN
ncbi:hypothetical protein JB92DRAFT_2940975 [Gautieria morchelliformis]|nr:hypothetical protein JB92DRAFT_2940975 [Gautieria morchelliformis]